MVVRLSDVEPAVWRLVRVSAGATLLRTARIIAVTMGWPMGRPYSFRVGKLPYVRRDQNGDGPWEGVGDREGEDVRLRQLLPDAGGELEFEYGNGHAWHLVVHLERLLPPNEEIRTPFCVSGSGSAPPVDVGGPWAYEEWRGDASAEHGVGHSNGWDDELGAARADGKPVTLRFNVEVINAELERI